MSAVSPGRLLAFEIDGTKWARPTATYYVNMEGISGTLVPWNTAFIDAMNEWTEKTLFDFELVEENFNPCLSNNISSVDFSDEFCGTEFGNNVLAVTLRRFESQILGPPRIREADIVINNEVEFNVYDGNIPQFGIDGLDFQRVALHELGHVIGLDHESQVQAIMAPNIGNTFELQQDDIDGVEALYTSLSNCEVDMLAFGGLTEGLNDNDCTVRDLTAGGTDNSFLDLYRFDLLESTDLTFTTTSSELDTVLILATTELDYLDVDTASPADCDSEINASLEAGSYFLIVNTFTQPVKEDCGVTGNYNLVSEFTSASQQSLGSGTSLNGVANTASFSGGVSRDKGLSFGNVFAANDSLDISAAIGVDPVHQGQAGFLVVAALVGNQILMLNAQSEFVDVSAKPLPAIAHATKVLGSTEAITIASDLIPASINIQELEANIVVGYGLSSNPADIFYHQVPLNLIIRN